MIATVKIKGGATIKKYTRLKIIFITTAIILTLFSLTTEVVEYEQEYTCADCSAKKTCFGRTYVNLFFPIWETEQFGELTGGDPFDIDFPEISRCMKNWNITTTKQESMLDLNGDLMQLHLHETEVATLGCRIGCIPTSTDLLVDGYNHDSDFRIEVQDALTRGVITRDRWTFVLEKLDSVDGFAFTELVCEHGELSREELAAEMAMQGVVDLSDFLDFNSREDLMIYDLVIRSVKG